MSPLWGHLKDRDKKIYDLWLACWTQEEIAEKLGIDQKTVSNVLEDFRKNGNFAKIPIPPTFEPELYDVWSLGKATNEVRYPKNIYNVYRPEKKGQGRYTT